MLAICSHVKSWRGKLLVSQWILDVCHMEEVCNIFRADVVFFVLYIRTTISCNRLLHKVDRLAILSITGVMQNFNCISFQYTCSRRWVGNLLFFFLKLHQGTYCLLTVYYYWFTLVWVFPILGDDIGGLIIWLKIDSFILLFSRSVKTFVNPSWWSLMRRKDGLLLGLPWWK